jgi:alpha-galactosidase
MTKRQPERMRAQRGVALLALGFAAILAGGCRRSSPPAESKFSAVTVISERDAARNTPIVIRLPGAEYDIWPSGYVQAFQIEPRTAQRLSIESLESGPSAWGDKLWADGKEVTDFSYDFRSLKASDVKSKVGRLGKHVEVTARSKSKQIEKTLSLEVFDDFPNLALEQITILNLGVSDLLIDRVQAQRHRLDASMAEVKARRNDFWSFQGASLEAGHDAVLPISGQFSQRNLMGAPVAVKGDLGSVGGGVPVVALWTATLGIAIGHVETVPQVLAFPVHTLPDGIVEIYMEVEPGVRLKPGERYSTPRSFVTTYNGDFFEPLKLYARVLGRQGSAPAKPNDIAYGAIWSVRADEPGSSPEQIVGTIPELKAMNIHWATLEGRWFDAAGDWQPRGDSFSAEGLQKLINEFHKQGIFVELAWTPLAVDDGEGSKKGGGARVAKEHPEWLVLDRNGHHARTAHNLAVFCPAVPEVREYYKKLVTQFIRQWQLDGIRLEDILTVPECYNPAHHHRSPQDSTQALGEILQTIFATTRTLRPASAVEISADATMPNFAWLPYLDRPLMVGPLSSAEIRRRIKMYKALLGPQTPVGNVDIEPGRPEALRNFATTVGTGGIPGTLFSGSAASDKSRPRLLAPDKEALCKKWMKIYSDLNLPQGDFQNLYVTGYDEPEGFAIKQNDKMYYAFFSPQPDKPWKGELDFRGLKRGRFTVVDYVEGKVLGTITSPRLRLAVQFTGQLLLEVSPEK